MIIPVYLLLGCPALKSLLKPLGSESLTEGDRRRLSLARPGASSHVYGEDAAQAFSRMNVFLSSSLARTRSCDEWAHAELDAVARELHAARIAPVRMSAAEPPNQGFKLYPYRWVQLGYLSLLALLSDWVCFSVAAAPERP